MFDQNEYYKKWWADNKKAVLKKRAARYRKDKTYRKSLIEASKLKAKLVPFFHAFDGKVIHDGVEELGYTLKRITNMQLINRSYDSLRHMNEAGIVPQPIHLKRNLWLYSESQIALVNLVLGIADTQGLTVGQTKDILTRFWDNIFSKKEVVEYVKEIKAAAKKSNRYRKAEDQKDGRQSCVVGR